MDFGTIEYWENYKAGLNYILVNRSKFYYYSKLIVKSGNEKKKTPIGEMDLQLTGQDIKRIEYELVKIDAIISVIKSINS